MPTHSKLRNTPPRRRGVAAWSFWLARWMLVVLLVGDQVGSPLHRHHHDSGVDGTWSTASAADPHEHEHEHEHEHDSHVDDADHDDHFGHATLAMRPASEVAKVFAAADVPQPLALPVAVLSLLLPEEVAEVRPRPGWRSPPIRSYRSLPPAGRAPPLLA